MARKVGLTLAAGEATRMPNKPLLPTIGPTGLAMGVAVESGMLLAWGAGCTLLRVLVRGSIVELALRSRGWRQTAYVQQSHEPGRVGDAIAAGVADLEDDDRVVVTFCDNVYDPAEGIDMQPWLMHDRPVASVRPLTDLPWDDRAHLDYFDQCEGVWCQRSAESADPQSRLYFAGWLIADAGTLRGCRGRTAVEFLNGLDFDPIIMEHEWHEVGTPAGYERYLRARQ